MMSCARFRDELVLYLDGELAGEEYLQFQRHQEQCGDCRQVLLQEKRFLDSLRSAVPSEAPPPRLQADVAALFRAQPGRRANRWPWLAAGGFAVLASLWLAALTVLLLEQRTLPVPSHAATDFAEAAVNLHSHYLGGRLPLEIAGDSPQAVAAWFDGKLPFRLPLAGEGTLPAAGQPYAIRGGRLVLFRNELAGYVAYGVGGHPVSLLVASADSATMPDSEAIAVRRLLFHAERVKGYKVITWSDAGLAYALVSDLDGRGQQSCVVCHHGSEDRDFPELLGKQPAAGF